MSDRQKLDILLENKIFNKKIDIFKWNKNENWLRMYDFYTF